jgi:hypothetical protein
MCNSFKLSSNNDTTTHLGFCDWLKKRLLFFFTMFITTWLQKIQCSCKGHQNTTWHHGFATIVNMATCIIFG